MYMWSVRKSGKGGRRQIEANAFDILALVALDIRVVAYLPITDRVKQTLHLRPPLSEFNATQVMRTNRRVNEYPIKEALEGLAYA